MVFRVNGSNNNPEYNRHLNNASQSFNQPKETIADAMKRLGSGESHYAVEEPTDPPTTAPTDPPTPEPTDPPTMGDPTPQYGTGVDSAKAENKNVKTGGKKVTLEAGVSAPEGYEMYTLGGVRIEVTTHKGAYILRLNEEQQ